MSIVQGKKVKSFTPDARIYTFTAQSYHNPNETLKSRVVNIQCHNFAKPKDQRNETNGHDKLITSDQNHFIFYSHMKRKEFVDAKGPDIIELNLSSRLGNRFRWCVK
jgi:hypothetical protein